MLSMRNVVAFGLVLAFAVSAFASMSALADDDDEADWVAVLNGANERPDPRVTRARGVALFFMNDDGTLDYKILVANINNVFAAHIHCGSAAVAGPVGVTLYMGTPASGRFDGVLVTGTISMPDAGNGCGWTTFAQVIAAMNGPDTYVNVHTNDGVAPTNTGPGDFPAGEIRGQIRLAD